jgi:putative membrane protein
MGFVFRWFILTIAVWVATVIRTGVTYDAPKDLLIAALVLSILNALFKPLLRLVSLPLIILSLGFFLLVINALLLRLTSALVPGFHVPGFWPAVWASLVISIVSFCLGYSRTRQPPRPPRPRPRGGWFRRSRAEPRNVTAQRGPPPGKGPIIDV